MSVAVVDIAPGSRRDRFTRSGGATSPGASKAERPHGRQIDDLSAMVAHHFETLARIDSRGASNPDVISCSKWRFPEEAPIEHADVPGQRIEYDERRNRFLHLTDIGEGRVLVRECSRARRAFLSAMAALGRLGVRGRGCGSMTGAAMAH